MITFQAKDGCKYLAVIRLSDRVGSPSGLTWPCPTTTKTSTAPISTMAKSPPVAPIGSKTSGLSLRLPRVGAGVEVGVGRVDAEAVPTDEVEGAGGVSSTTRMKKTPQTTVSNKAFLFVRGSNLLAFDFMGRKIHLLIDYNQRWLRWPWLCMFPKLRVKTKVYN